MEIGVYIRNARSKKGLSARKLAEKSGVSQAYLSQLETGQNNKPSAEILQKISKGLDISYLELMDEAGYLTNLDEIEEAIKEDRAFDETPVTVYLPRFVTKLDEDGILTRSSAKPEDLKKLLFDIHSLLNMGIDLHYKDRLLTKEEKKKILTMLETILE
ncbi:helix-turn-helix domain-containing protein [Lentibacillus sediminis]|uniref:helix-turn-helix domain-containing protein n=1 Tax=Lentibacillus sediminis TaxID=1940529 RepID=UPI000C1C1384|nr:helix-turn-helix transcriptional regulator [Lentibacillus sediminis]